MRNTFLILGTLALVFLISGKTLIFGNEPSNSWFKTEKISDHIWRIDDHGSDNIYLVIGKDSALLIDAGLGIGDLKAIVESITKLPLIVVNTHGHPDHVGSDYQFSKVYIHEADLEAAKKFLLPESLKNMSTVFNSEYSLSDEDLKRINSAQLPRFSFVKQGYTFNLGGVSLKVVEVPGHTAGSICLYDEGNQLLFAGDHNNQMVWLFLKECMPLEVYLKSLQSLTKLNIAKIYPGHGQVLERSFLDDQIACVQSILNGTCVSELHESFAGTSRLCRYKTAAVAYDPEKLFVK